ncbi:ABC transporter atnG [Beauveria bassiana]|nr:ABC transporter atnG [Beauveria bassiana]
MVPDMDQRFGPQLAGHFDFTLLFEQTIFEIAPNSVFVLATPFFLKSIASHAAKQVRPGPLLWAKMALGALLLAAYIAKAALWQSKSELHSQASIASSIISLVTSLCTLVVIYSAHVYRRRPSAFMSVFFSITMLLDMALTRSYFLRHEMGYSSMQSIAAIQIVVVVVKLLLVVMEEVPKTTPSGKENVCSNVKGDSELGFWGKALFCSVSSLLLFGYKNELGVENLPPLDEQFESRVLFDAFFKHWSKLDRDGKFVLLRACLRTILCKFLAMVIPRLCYAAFSLSRPFLIQRVLEVVNSGTTTYQHATGLIGAAILIYAGIAISRAIFERIQYQVKVSIRGVLSVALFDKMQRLSIDEKQSAAAITLMTTDVMGVEAIIALLHEVWVTCLELGFAVYILYMFVDLACFLIFIPSILATISTYYSAKNMAKARGQWNAKISDRVQATSTVLNQLKDIKAMGLSHSISDYLQEKRKEEVIVSLRERRSRVIMFATSAFNLSMTPVIVLAGARFWTRSNPTMTAAEIFSAYSVILIASEPLDSLLERTIMWASSYACITRIQNYLSLPELKDPRQVTEPAQDDGDSNEKSDKLLLEKSNNFAIRMEDVVVRSEHGRDILKSVNLGIPPGSLAMMHGTVGSGNGGKVSIMSNDISFAAQKPWIQNLTIRENIIGANPVVESLYKEIIHGCALDIDLAELPSADETMCGTDGCNLSGGQKQRLGLARSLYSNASIVILDDVLSALDTSTAAAVFSRLFGPGGFLRRRGTTVIMTTNRLNFLPAADIVLEMKGDGTIDEPRGADMPLLAEFAPSSAASASTDTCESEKKVEPIKSTTTSPGTKVDKMRRNGDVSLYAYLFRSAGPLLMSLWILGTAVASVAEKMPKIFIKIWYSNDPDNDTYFVGFAMTALANILLTAITTLFYFIMIVPNLSNELHWRLLNATVKSTLSWITQTDTGTSLNRFSQDISIISQQLPIALLQFLFILCNTLVDVGIFAAGANYAAPIVLMLLVALYDVQYFYLRTSRQLRLLDLETSAPLLTHFKEASAGMQHLRAFRWQETFMKECCRLVDRMQKPYYALLSVQQWLALVLDISTCFIATILIAVSTTLPNSTSDTSVGLALINLISFSIMTSALIRVWVALETCLGGLARIRTFCATTPQETDGASCSPVPEQWPSSGRIEIESISASYTYEDGTLHQALDNASVVIEHGEKAGISGRTGSGKSSLFLALLHMIECTGGTIRIDGRDITTIPREVLRSRITVLTQDGVEVEHSVRFNMYPFDDHQPTDESILETLDLVGLSEQVQSQGGVEVAMASMQFSPGQKQLFFVARGILHHKSVGSKIVMTDEATSSMDYGVDRQIQKLIDEQLTNCTIVLIAHRLHSLDNADVVVKLEAGKVVEVARRCRTTTTEDA